MKQQIQISITIVVLACLGFGAFAQTQEVQPYREIPDYPDSYNAANMASRMVDGLGFRFYWATEGLGEKDLAFRPTAKARNVDETIDHILSMCYLLVNSINPGTEVPKKGLSFHEKRDWVLNNLKTASDILRKSNAEDLETYTLDLGNGDSLPFWNFVNGPLADCIWHCGQIASFRRLSGNPFNSKVSLLMGKLMD